MVPLVQIGLANAAAALALAAVAAVAGRFCRRPAVVHSLWLLVLVKLITPTPFSLAVAESPVAWSDEAQATPVVAKRQPPEESKPEAAETPSPEADVEEVIITLLGPDAPLELKE